MEKFDVKKHWDDFINNRLVINCETEKLAEEFLKYCHEQGMKWCGNSSLIIDNNAWNASREDTCYFCKNKFITHASKRYALSKNYIVTNYQGINKEITKENIEVIYHDNETIVLIKGDKKYYRGVSKCNPEDTYNREYGFLLAYQRARAKELGI